ncbi:hypothetical protein ACLKA6_018214 [Drosophila palustris]
MSAFQWLPEIIAISSSCGRKQPSHHSTTAPLHHSNTTLIVDSFGHKTRKLINLTERDVVDDIGRLMLTLMRLPQAAQTITQADRERDSDGDGVGVRERNSSKYGYNFKPYPTVQHQSVVATQVASLLQQAPHPSGTTTQWLLCGQQPPCGVWQLWPSNGGRQQLSTVAHDLSLSS